MSFPTHSSEHRINKLKSLTIKMNRTLVNPDKHSFKIISDRDKEIKKTFFLFQKAKINITLELKQQIENLLIHRANLLLEGKHEEAISLWKKFIDIRYNELHKATARDVFDNNKVKKIIQKRYDDKVKELESIEGNFFCCIESSAILSKILSDIKIYHKVVVGKYIQNEKSDTTGIMSFFDDRGYVHHNWIELLDWTILDATHTQFERPDYNLYKDTTINIIDKSNYLFQYYVAINKFSSTVFKKKLNSGEIQNIADEI